MDIIFLVYLYIYIILGSGDYMHYLHHALFEYNYGENNVPLDWLFGSFIDHDPNKKKWNCFSKNKYKYITYKFKKIF